jgi:hypothetical protein
MNAYSIKRKSIKKYTKLNNNLGSGQKYGSHEVTSGI